MLSSLSVPADPAPMAVPLGTPAPRGFRFSGAWVRVHVMDGSLGRGRVPDDVKGRMSRLERTRLMLGVRQIVEDEELDEEFNDLDEMARNAASAMQQFGTSMAELEKPLSEFGKRVQRSLTEVGHSFEKMHWEKVS